mgnify:FL=1
MLIISWSGILTETTNWMEDKTGDGSMKISSISISKNSSNPSSLMVVDSNLTWVCQMRKMEQTWPLNHQGHRQTHPFHLWVHKYIPTHPQPQAPILQQPQNFPQQLVL